MTRLRVSLLMLLFCGVSLRHHAAHADAYDPPPSHYSSATGTGATLKAQLNAIIDDHTTRSYDQLRSDLQVTDADPNNPSRLVLLYNNRISIAKPIGGSPPGWDNGATWNREHSWPQSRGVDTTAAPDGTDLHHVFPTYTDENNVRGNLNFGGAFGAQSFGVVNDGGTKYYPGDFDAGMVARSEFYMAVRYDGVDSGSQDLELATNNPTDGGTTLGDLNRLIEWHFAAPPDTYERRRNQVIYESYQGNRNPFIDHPEYVWSIFARDATNNPIPNDSQISIAGATVSGSGASMRNVDLGRIFVGGSVPAAESYSLNKNGTHGTYYEVTTSGAATSSIAGRFNAFRTNQTGLRLISVGLDTTTTTAGLKAGAVTIDNLDVTTGSGMGRGASDANDTFNVSLTVLDHATPSFASSGSFTTLSHDFGSVAIGDNPAAFNFRVHNLPTTAGFTASMDFDSVAPSGSTAAFTTNLTASAGSLVLASGTSQAFLAAFTATAAGTYSATYQLNFSDENIAGALSKSITLTLTGRARLAGDYNNDLIVNAADYAEWRRTFGQTVISFSGADGDGDGIVNDADFGVWRSHFGQTATAGSGVGGTTIPEPSGCVTAIAIALVLASSGGRRHRLARQAGFGD